MRLLPLLTHCGSALLLCVASAFTISASTAQASTAQTSTAQASTAQASTAPAADAKIPIILSTDVGNEVDDQWTIAYALLSPRIEVLGIVSAHAPSISAPAGYTSYRILVDAVENRLGMTSHPPLLAGADVPLENTRTPQVSEGVNFIIETSKNFSRDNRLTVLTIGAVTDIASAILKDPTIVERIRVIDMGFKERFAGGDEFNIANDVKAMQVVLESDVPLVVGPADVCRQNLALSLDQAREMISNRGPVGGWLWEEFQAWYYRHVKPLRKNDFSKPWIIWDNITLAYTLGMTKQEVRPRPRMRDDMTFEVAPTNKTITWITDVDEQRMWADFLIHLDAYQRTHAIRGEKAPKRLSFMSP